MLYAILKKWCFNRCNNLRSINIPSSITLIEDSCFIRCSKLKEIIIHAITAPTLSGNPFYASDGFGGYSYCTGRDTYKTGENMLYVPSNATGYETSYWSDTLLDSNKCGFTLSKTL